MTAPVFFVEPQQLTADVCRISGDEGRHAATVKRMRVGERIDVCDGMGNRASGLVQALGRDWVDVNIDSRTRDGKNALQFVAVQAVAKGDRGDLAIEVLTEVGVDQIIPWQSQHSVAKWDDSGKSLSKWERVAREASKQSRRSWVPDVRNALNTDSLISELANYECVVVLHESADASLAEIALPGSGAVAIVIGPEGGISSAELDAFQGIGAQVVRMGQTVMRTSTAGGVALAVMAAKTPRWNATK